MGIGTNRGANGGRHSGQVAGSGHRYRVGGGMAGSRGQLSRGRRVKGKVSGIRRATCHQQMVVGQALGGQGKGSPSGRTRGGKGSDPSQSPSPPLLSNQSSGETNLRLPHTH